MSITLHQINKQIVKAIPLPEEDNRPIRGFDICEEVYANIFFCAKKKSGKTSALFKLVKECAGKDTVIIAFCSTLFKDKNWIAIRKYFEKKKRDFRGYTSIYEDGEDQLDKLINELSEEAREKEIEEENKDEPHEKSSSERCDDIFEQLKRYNDHLGNFLEHHQGGGEVVEPEKKKKRDKYLSPEYIIILDDLSNELKSPSLLRLLKFNRHFKTKIIISSQWLHDLLPESRKQLDLFVIFRGFPIPKLKEIYKDADLSISFELFYKLYRKATKKRFNFLYIDTISGQFRRNYDQQFIFHEKEEY